MRNEGKHPDGNLPFDLILGPANTKRSQKGDKCARPQQLELFLRDRHNSHGRVLGVAQIGEVHVAPEQNCVVLGALVLLVLLLDLLEVGAHGAELAQLNFAIISVSQVPH